MTAERVAIMAANLLAITALPASLGRLGAHLLVFALYVAVGGLVLVALEDARYLRLLFQRADVRSYLAVRMMLVAAGALCPYLAAALL